FSYAKKLGVQNIAISARSLYDRAGYAADKHMERFHRVVYFIEGGLLGIYRFEKYKKIDNGNSLKKITVLYNGPALPVKRLNTVISAVYLARDLVNMPSNDLTPMHMSEYAKAVTGEKVKVGV